jgi:AraC-like DNA-binding protein
MDNDSRLQRILDTSAFAEELFDRLADVVFFLKDPHGRYRMVNQTLVTRCGARSKKDLLGRTAREVFPAPLGVRFLEQDLAVCRTGSAVTLQLELHLYPTRVEGWCLTDKVPLRDHDGKIVGVAGISRDLQSTGTEAEGFAELAAVLDHTRTEFGGELRVDDLASRAGLSIYQLNRRLRLLFGITASQLVTKTRIDAASEMLRTTSRRVADIAHACGYFDQSAFSRVFRRTVGLTPRQYRDRHHH